MAKRKYPQYPIKQCLHCEKKFTRTIFPSGLEEPFPKFQKRKFCSLYCHRHSNYTKSIISKGFLGKKHSQATIEKMKKAHNEGRYPKMEQHPNWKGGRFIHPTGYVWIKQPNNPNAHKSGYIPEHRYVMENFLKRPLKKYEQVHHINGIKTDNNIKNLELRTRNGHRGYIKCPYCHKGFSMKF